MFNKSQFISAQYKTNCLRCKELLKKVQSLLYNLKDIRKSETVVVCDNCRKTCVNLCPRCKYIANKFKIVKEKQIEEYQLRLGEWVCKVKLFLQAILEGSPCLHTSKQNFTYFKELEKLLNQLKSSVTFREVEVEIFPTLQKLTSLGDFQESKELIEEILSLINSNDYCICPDDDILGYCGAITSSNATEEKLLKSIELKPGLKAPHPSRNKFSNLLSGKENLGQEMQNMIGGKPMGLLQKKENSYLKLKKGQPDTKIEKERTTFSTKRRDDVKRGDLDAHRKKQKDKKYENKSSKNKGIKDDKGVSGPSIKKDKKGGVKEPKLTSDSLDFDFLIKQEKMRKMKLDKEARAKSGTHKKDIQKNIEKLIELPMVPILDLQAAPESDEEFVADEGCKSVPTSAHNKMIKGTKLVGCDPQYKDIVTVPEKAILFNVKTANEDEGLFMKTAPISKDSGAMISSTKGSISPEQEEKVFRRGFVYQLSNRHYIDKGWTILPTTKIMRRICSRNGFEHR